jgi:transcriptional regulator with XRE-family HTH domain
MNTETQAFSQRLIDAMQQAGYQAKPAVLEREFNLRYWGKSVTLQGVRRWLRGEAIPSGDKLDTLVEWLGVNKQYLLYGEQAVKAATEQVARWDAKITPEEREIIELFIDLPADVKKSIGLMIKSVSRHC